jgi:hypothetical protein
MILSKDAPLYSVIQSLLVRVFDQIGPSYRITRISDIKKGAAAPFPSLKIFNLYSAPS